MDKKELNRLRRDAYEKTIAFLEADRKSKESNDQLLQFLGESPDYYKVEFDDDLYRATVLGEYEYIRTLKMGDPYKEQLATEEELELMRMPIESMGLSKQACEYLHKMGYHVFYDLVARPVWNIYVRVDISDKEKDEINREYLYAMKKYGYAYRSYLLRYDEKEKVYYCIRNIYWFDRVKNKQ